MKTSNIAEPQDFPVMISDEAWQSIHPFLKTLPNVYVGSPGTVGVVVWLTKQGATWRALPKVYGYCNSIYRRFGHWCDAGVFEKLHEHFHAAGELSALLVDSTIVRAHSCAAGAPKKMKDRFPRRHLVGVAVAYDKTSCCCESRFASLAFYLKRKKQPVFTMGASISGNLQLLCVPSAIHALIFN